MPYHRGPYSKARRVLFAFLLSLIASFAVPSTARSQAALLVLLFGEDVASENFYFTLKLGANLSNLSGIEGSKNALGLNFGLGVNIRLSDRFYLVPEFMPLSSKGAKSIPFQATGNSDLDQLIQPTTSTAREMNYIDIPIVAKYYVTEELGLEAGPQISILTSATDVYRGKINEDDDLVFENDVKSRLNTIDVGVVAGVTYSLWDARGGKGLYVHARYAYGLTDMVKDNPGNAIKNSLFQFAVSFPFINPPALQEGAK
jgi:hypothetical protein